MTLENKKVLINDHNGPIVRNSNCTRHPVLRATSKSARQINSCPRQQWVKSLVTHPTDPRLDQFESENSEVYFMQAG
ncbi:hypothetical protein M8J77_008176 [Diaphorina citri]|nr:hypothetical protein M8J77_008176 [Diaphorina citri]